MTAHCLPLPGPPELEDLKKAWEFLAIAVDPAISYREAANRIALELGEIRTQALQASSPLLSLGILPRSGEGEPPSGRMKRAGRGTDSIEEIHND